MRRVLLIASLIVAAAAGSAFAAAAVKPPAPAAPASAKPEVSFYGDWSVRCFPIKSVSPCDMLFATVRKDSGQRVTSVSIAYVPARDVYLMQVAVPLGIDLAKGVIMTAGDYTTAKLAVRRCDASGCFVETSVGRDVIDGLWQNAEQGGNLKVVADGGKPVTLPVSLKGFGSAYQAMVASAKEKATGSASTAGQ